MTMANTETVSVTYDGREFGVPVSGVVLVMSRGKSEPIVVVDGGVCKDLELGSEETADEYPAVLNFEELAKIESLKGLTDNTDYESGREPSPILVNPNYVAKIEPRQTGSELLFTDVEGACLEVLEAPGEVARILNRQDLLVSDAPAPANP